MSSTINSVGAGMAVLAGGGSAVVGGTTLTAGFGSMVAAGAIGGAAGSIVSQGVGVATGIQDKFSWNAVAMAAIGGGIGAGLGFVAQQGPAWAARMLQSQFVQGAVGSALTQGIGDAIGVHGKFSWTAVAAAGLGASLV